jgi:hypothetical protein
VAFRERPWLSVCGWTGISKGFEARSASLCQRLPTFCQRFANGLLDLVDLDDTGDRDG